MPDSDAGRPGSPGADATAHIAASSRADHARPTARHPMPADWRRQPARGPAGSAADVTSPRRHDGVHRALAEPIRARAARGRDSALTGPSPGARGVSGSRQDRAAWRSAAADPHNASTPEHQSRTLWRRLLGVPEAAGARAWTLMSRCGNQGRGNRGRRAVHVGFAHPGLSRHRGRPARRRRVGGAPVRV